MRDCLLSFSSTVLAVLITCGAVTATHNARPLLASSVFSGRQSELLLALEWQLDARKEGRDTEGNGRKDRIKEGTTEKGDKKTNKQIVLGRTNRLLSFDTTRTAWETMPPIILRCRRNVFTKPLPSSDRGIYTGRPTVTDWSSLL
jgi:hypothetical protein